jgi:DNA-binding response OmpR family regulator
MNRALVVDDELEICLMVTKHLQRRQFETDYALTVKDALKKVNHSEFELMFVDLNLADGSGFDVISDIQELNRDSKIIVISAYDYEIHKVLEKGANFFLAKPFTIRMVDDALKSLNFLT